MTLRVIGGEFKGRKLRSLRGDSIRPTADRVREAIFNILSADLRTSAVLDLFAGTGALGIEALSRGAASVVFADNSKPAISVIKRNIEICALQNRTQVLNWNIAKNLNCFRNVRSAFDLVFMDPPYNKALIEPALANLHDSGCLKDGARITIEHSVGESLAGFPGPFQLADQRKYGKTLVSFFNCVL